MVANHKTLVRIPPPAPNDMKKTIKNSVKCKMCGQVIESKHITDYIACACGAVAVSGGAVLNRKHCLSKDQYIDLSECREFTKEELMAEIKKANEMATVAIEGFDTLLAFLKRRE